jgi:hypothetical protein
VRKLIAAPEGVRPRVHETKNAVTPVRGEDDQRGESGTQHDDQYDEQARPHAAEKENAHGDRDDHHESAKVRFLEQQDADGDHRARQRQKGLLQIVHVRHLARRVVGGIEDGKQLHQLGGLQVGDAQRQPAARTIDLATDTGNQHQRQQHEATDEQPRRPALPGRPAAPESNAMEATSATTRNTAWRSENRSIDCRSGARPRQWPSRPNRP